MPAYYNEWEPYPAQWLRNLIAASLIAPGDVDERSIKDVKADDLKGYTQCHFFAGIGGWSHALRLAGWSDERPVWTGSCPCQPFSSAGHRKGFSDERHLWPDFYKLIGECKPSICFGEQVASKDGLEWLDRVCADVEASHYAFSAIDLCAAGVGAPHIRQRIYWLANAEREGLSGRVFERADEDPIVSAKNRSRSARYQQWEEGNSKSPIPVLDNGFPADMAASAAFGNAIVPQVAQAFIESFMECRP